jgi:serine protease Do
VFEKSPGQKANLGVGDVITSVNGQAVLNSGEMQKATLALPVGQVVDVLVTRNGQQYLTRVAVEDQPDDFGQAPAPGGAARQPVDFDGLGLAVTELTPEVAARNGVPKDVKGVVVSGVAPNGLAARSGLSRGMLVIQVNKTPVATADGFRQAVEQSDRERGAVLHVLRPDGAVDFVILRTQ